MEVSSSYKIHSRNSIFSPTLICLNFSKPFDASGHCKCTFSCIYLFIYLINLFVYLFICNLLIPLMDRIEWSFSLKLTVTSSFILLPQNLLKNNVPLLLVEILQNYTGSFPASRFFKSSSFIKGFRFFIILVVIYYNNTSIYYNTSKYTSNTILPYLCLQFKINTFVSILVFCTSNWTYKSSEIS